MRYLWMPRLVERIQAASSTAANIGATNTATNNTIGQVIPNMPVVGGGGFINTSFTPDNSSTAASSDSFVTQISSDLTHEYYNYPVNRTGNQDYYQVNQISNTDSLTSPSGYNFNQGLDFQAMEEQNNLNQWFDAGDLTNDNLWNVEDIWFLQQQLNNM